MPDAVLPMFEGIARDDKSRLLTALTGTGKYADGQRTSANWKEDYFLDSVADLPQLLSQLR